MGLYIAHEIVRGHGGELQVKSDIGKGSSFRVTLPAAIRPPGVAEPAEIGTK
jgi:signal transduction histidine kinase